MHYVEAKWLNGYNLDKTKNFYLRNVDGILASFDKEQDSLIFLNFRHKRHPNFKFTIKKKLNILLFSLMYSFQVLTSKSQTPLHWVSLKFQRL